MIIQKVSSLPAANNLNNNNILQNSNKTFIHKIVDDSVSFGSWIQVTEKGAAVLKEAGKDVAKIIEAATKSATAELLQKKITLTKPFAIWGDFKIVGPKGFAYYSMRELNELTEEQLAEEIIAVAKYIPIKLTGGDCF